MDLHVKLRPTTFEDILGQEAAVQSIVSLFEADRVPHALLLSGPSGVGKTTIARIFAAAVGCSTPIEVDGARFSGVDQMRELVKGVQYVAMGDSPIKVVVMDECHRCSKQAFDALLLTVEEPPSHLYWAFCTTEPDKVPTAIRTRCHAYDLKPVKWEILSDYLHQVRHTEKLDVRKEFIDIAARKANGSVRQALVNLSVLEGVKDKEQALRLVEDAEAREENDPALKLAKMLVSGQGCTWENARDSALAALEASTPEGIRITILNYATGALVRAKKGEALQLLAIMQNFAGASWGSKADLYLALGQLLLV